MADTTKLDNLSDAELEQLHARVTETRAARAVEKTKIAGESFDIDDIKPGMSQEQISAAWAAVARATAKGDRR